MSYPMGLDEYSDKELRQELERRLESRGQGLCDYCGRKATKSPCRFALRHCAAEVGIYRGSRSHKSEGGGA